MKHRSLISLSDIIDVLVSILEPFRNVGSVILGMLICFVAGLLVTYVMSNIILWVLVTII